MPKVVAVIMAGGQGSRLFPLTKMRSKPAVPDRRPLPADRHPDQQLHPLRLPAHLRPDPVRQRVAPPPHLPDLPLRRLPRGFRHPALGPADPREPRLVPGHGRRRPPEPDLHQGPGRPRPHPVRRPSLPDGLPEVRRVPRPDAGPTSASRSFPSRPTRSASSGCMKVDAGRASSPSSGRSPGTRRPSRPCGSEDDVFARFGVAARRPDAPRLDGHLRLQPRRPPASSWTTNAYEDFGKQIIPEAIRPQEGLRLFLRRLLGGHRDDPQLLRGQPRT